MEATRVDYSNEIEVTNDVDVFVQDQNSQLADFYFKRLINNCTLSQPTVLDSNIIYLTAGHGVQVNEYIAILEGNRVYQSKVTNVATNTITLDTPLDYTFTVDAEVRRCTIDMNVDGSTTPVIFDIKPIGKQIWDVTTITLSIISGSAMDDSKFGSLAELTKGLLIRKKDGVYYNISNIKSNFDMKVSCYDLNYTDKAPQGAYGMVACKRYSGQHNNGVTIRIHANRNESLQIIVRDNLSTLTKFNCMVHGHFVED